MKRLIILVAALLLIPAVSHAVSAGLEWTEELANGTGEILYHFNETSGNTAFDYSGNARNGAVTDSDTVGVEWGAGKFGNAIVGDGKPWPELATMVAGQLYVSAAEALDMTQATVQAWINFTGDKVSAQVLQIGAFIDMRTDADGLLEGRVFDSGWRTVRGTTVVQALGGWNHVAFVFDGTLENRSLKLYINGNLEAEASYIGANGSIGRDIEYTYDFSAVDNYYRASSTWAYNRGLYGSMDDFRFSYDAVEFQPIPEPATMTLFGALLLGLVRRKK